MCGIVGVFSLRSSGLIRGDADTLRQLVVANTVRGYDGTGIMFLEEKTKKLFYYKQAVTGSELLPKSQWEKFCGNTRFVVGHNRAATSGIIDEEHSHPFTYDNVTGVHNGTILGWESIDSLQVPDQKATMDSMAIFEALSRADEDMESASEIISSLTTDSYSLVWYDSRAEELRFARNSQRPMNFVKTHDAVWFGSELDMVMWVLKRNRESAKETWSLNTNTIVGVPIDGGTANVHSYTPNYSSGRGYQNTGKYGGFSTLGWATETTTKKTTTEDSGRGGSNPLGTRFQTGGNGTVRDTAEVERGVIQDGSEVSSIYVPSLSVFDFGNLPTLNAISAVRPLLYTKARQMIGCNLSTNSKKSEIFDLKHAIMKHVSAVRDIGKNQGIITNYQNKTVGVPVQIVSLDEANSVGLGFVDIDDDRFPVEVKLKDEATKRRVRSLLASGWACRTRPLPLVGLKFYCSGDAGYLVDPEDLTVASISAGKSITSEEGVALINLYGTNHPIRVSKRIDTSGNWTESWAA